MRHFWTLFTRSQHTDTTYCASNSFIQNCKLGANCDNLNISFAENTNRGTSVSRLQAVVHFILSADSQNYHKSECYFPCQQKFSKTIFTFIGPEVAIVGWQEWVNHNKEQLKCSYMRWRFFRRKHLHINVWLEIYWEFMYFYIMLTSELSRKKFGMLAVYMRMWDRRWELWRQWSWGRR